MLIYIYLINKKEQLLLLTFQLFMPNFVFQLQVVFESNNEAPLVNDEQAYYYLSSDPGNRRSFDGNTLFNGFSLKTPFISSDNVVVHFRRNVTSELELDTELKVTARVDYKNPSGECVLPPSGTFLVITIVCKVSKSVLGSRGYICCSSSSSIYWTGPFPGVKSPIEACALRGGSGAAYAVLKQLI